MRLTVLTGLIYAGAAAFALGCSQQDGRPGDEPDDELAALTERSDRLRERLAARTVSNDELRPEFEQLLEDARAWQSRTGRTDIRTGTDSTRATDTGVAARDDDGGGGDRECASCPGYRVDGDNICFLTYEGPCPEPDDELEIGPICVYDCIWIGSGPEPGREVEVKE